MPTAAAGRVGTRMATAAAAMLANASTGAASGWKPDSAHRPTPPAVAASATSNVHELPGPGARSSCAVIGPMIADCGSGQDSLIRSDRRAGRGGRAEALYDLAWQAGRRARDELLVGVRD